MFGLFMVAWVVAPLLILAVSLGLGLLIRRLADGRPGDVFLLPVGFAAALVLGSLFTQWDATAELLPFALLIGALAGLAVEGRALLGRLRPSRELLWPATAAFLGFGVFAAPVVFSGEPGFTGFGRIVDLGHHFDFAAYLIDHGREVPASTPSSYLDVARKLLAPGYPGAWQADLAAYSWMLGTDLIWIYQPLLAITAAMGALSLYGVLRRAIESQPLRALAAGVAIQANVLYAYGLVSGFKELSAAVLLMLAVGLASELPPMFSKWRAGIPLAVAAAACVAAFSLGILPWLGVIVAGFLVVTLVRSRLGFRVAVAWASVAVVTLLLSVPAIVGAAKLAPVAAKAEGTASGRTALTDLGNLDAKMPARAATGIWPNEDYRYPNLVAGGLTEPVMVLVLALAVWGAFVAVRRRDWGVALLAAAGGIAFAYYMARTGPWIQLKAIGVTGVVVLACAFAGAAALGTWLASRRRILGLGATSILAGVVAVAVLYGNALAYHGASLAPADRLRDLERIADRYAGRGPTFYPDFDDAGQYLLRHEDGVGIVDPPATRIPARRPGAATPTDEQGFSLDTDLLTLPYIQSFKLIVRRTGPARSRPPSNWDLVERTRYNEVWRRTRPSSSVLLHEPFEGPRPTCDSFARKARSLERSGPVRIAYVEAPETTRFRLGVLEHPPAWSPKTPSSLILHGQGNVTGSVRLPRSGDYKIWIAGAFGRVTRISVDGEQVAAVKNDQSYPDHYVELGTRRLAAGSHRIEMSKPNGSLEPGDAAGDEVPVGPIVFVRPRPLPVKTAPVKDAFRICDRGGLDWMEIVRAR